MAQRIRKPQSETHVQLNQTPTYRSLVVENYAERPATIAEYDLQAHIDDSRSFWLYRGGRLMKRTWRELTRTEKLQQQEAERRAADVALNDPCYAGGY